MSVDRATAESSTPAADFDVVIVGAGFAGMYMLHRVRALGLSARLLEAGAGVGGTWFWNRYPGARCDIESMEYSFQFSEELQQTWHWTERYAGQAEIVRYANHVADRFGLRVDMQFNTRVEAATFDEADNRWQVRACGEGPQATILLTGRFLVMATGCLSSANLPAFKGLQTYTGERYHTGLWPDRKVDFTGKRVAVIGTGSSAVQSIPLIAQEAAGLVVFQRTATYSIPARNGPQDADYEARIKADYAAFRARNSRMPNAFGSTYPRNETSALEVALDERERAFEERWQRGGLGFLGAFGDLILSSAANETAAEFVRRKIRAVVQDPAVADLLAPRQVIGCKRMCIDSGYYETFNRPNVRLVDISSAPIEELTPVGLRCGGRDFEFDCIIFATGFDAMTGTLLKIDIRGRGGRTLAEKWQAGPRTYLGLAIAGFPNLFTISGPGSPSVLTNMIVSIEQHVDWIAECMAYMHEHGHARIEASSGAEDAWVEHVNAVADRTLYPTCNSWYLGVNVPGKTRVFMPLVGFPTYVEKTRDVAARGYAGFALTPA